MQMQQNRSGNRRGEQYLPASSPKPRKKHLTSEMLQRGTGSDLSSRAVSSQVLSALESLTTVFGMGTGGTSPSLPPVGFRGSSTSFLSPFGYPALVDHNPFGLHPDNCTSFRFNISDLQLISLFSFVLASGSLLRFRSASFLPLPEFVCSSA